MAEPARQSGEKNFLTLTPLVPILKGATMAPPEDEETAAQKANTERARELVDLCFLEMGQTTNSMSLHVRRVCSRRQASLVSQRADAHARNVLFPRSSWPRWARARRCGCFCPFEAVGRGVLFFLYMDAAARRGGGAQAKNVTMISAWDQRGGRAAIAATVNATRTVWKTSVGRGCALVVSPRRFRVTRRHLGGLTSAQRGCVSRAPACQ